MFEIKHTLCPSCSVGCGINVILDGEEIIGTFPYKRHPVNAGKNCANGRNSIDFYNNKFESLDLNNAIADALKDIKSSDASDVTVICSGNNSIEEIGAIKEFAESKEFLLTELKRKKSKAFAPARWIKIETEGDGPDLMVLDCSGDFICRNSL